METIKRKRGRPSKSVSHETIVTPGITINGQEHAFQSLEKAGQLPVVRSVGVARAPSDSRQYVSYVITSQGNKVLKMEIDEPNVRAVAIESAKINFIQEFTNDDGEI